MLENKEMKEIKWVNSNTQLANSLQKCGTSSDLSINVLSTGKPCVSRQNLYIVYKEIKN